MRFLAARAPLLLTVGVLLVAWPLVLLAAVDDPVSSDRPAQAVLVVGLIVLLAGAAGLAARRGAFDRR